MNRHKAQGMKLIAGLGAAVLALGLAGCAPEMGDVAGSTEKDSQTINPESEASEREVTEYDFNTELPESFPSDEFAIPETAVIEDVGESGTDQWYLVLRAPDSEAEEAIWNEIIESNGFGVTDEGEAAEGGRLATLNGVSITTQVLTIPQSDGSVQMSFEILRWS